MFKLATMHLIVTPVMGWGGGGGGGGGKEILLVSSQTGNEKRIYTVIIHFCYCECSLIRLVYCYFQPLMFTKPVMVPVMSSPRNLHLLTPLHLFP